MQYCGVVVNSLIYEIILYFSYIKSIDLKYEIRNEYVTKCF